MESSTVPRFQSQIAFSRTGVGGSGYVTVKARVSKVDQRPRLSRTRTLTVYEVSWRRYAKVVVFAASAPERDSRVAPVDAYSVASHEPCESPSGSLNVQVTVRLVPPTTAPARGLEMLTPGMLEICTVATDEYGPP